MSRVEQVGKIRGSLRSVRDERHGTISGYYYWGCRCNKCRESALEYQRQRIAVRGKEMTVEDHGTISGYQNCGCRCTPCTKAYSAYNKERRDGLHRTKKTTAEVDLTGLA